MNYYFNTQTKVAWWKEDAIENGWCRTLIDNHNPQLGEKYFNIFTNKAFSSKAEYLNYISNKQKQQFDKKYREIYMRSQVDPSWMNPLYP